MLAARLALSFLLPTLALLLVVGFLAERVAQRTFEDQLSERLVDISLATRNQFSNKYYQRPKTWTALDASKPVMMENIRVRIEPIKAETGVRRMLLFRPDNTSIFDTRYDGEGRFESYNHPIYELALDAHELEEVKLGTPRSSVLYCAAESDLSTRSDRGGILGCPEGQIPYKSAYAPVFDRDGALVAILGVEGSADTLKALFEFRRNFVLLGLSGVVVLILASILISRRLTRPIQQLSEAARRIGDGDLERPIPRTRSDELGSLETSLEEMRQALRDRDRTMQMMLSGVAHEVRNPLGGIKLFLGLLEEDLVVEGHLPDSEIRQHVDKIQRELNYLNRVVNEFLEFARYSGIDAQRFESRPFVEEIADVMMGDLRQHDVTLKTHISEDASELTADRDRLRRVVLNLIRNAWQASPPGSVVTLSISAPSPELREVQVVDEGSGIAPEQLAEVFKPFFTTREKGTGLGLPLTQKILESHGGVAEIQSTLGEGSTITLRWPFDHGLLPAQKSIPEGWLG